MSDYNATLKERIDITPQAVIMRVVPDGDGFEFTPGQFTVLGLKRSAPRLPESDPEDPVAEDKAERLIRRAYSLSSDCFNKDYVEFYISLVMSGELTPRLFCLQAGDRLFMGPKASGLFTLERAGAGNRLLLVATGTGLAPYMSMLRSQIIGCPTQPLAVLHGASYSWDLGYRGELEGLARQCPNFSYIPVISRPQGDPDWRGRTGRLNVWIDNPALSDGIGFALDPANTHVFLCGHPGMVEEASTQFTAKGFNAGSRKEPGNLHAEKYW